MQIVIPDDYNCLFNETADLERLRSLGELKHYNEKPKRREDLIERLAEAEIILTTRYHTDFKNTDLLDHIRKLRFISIMGTRPRMIDMKKANTRNILVSITPGSSSTSVAEHAMMLILSLSKQLPALGPAMRNGEWPRQLGQELAGKTLSLLGFGYIGGKMVRMALGFGIKVITWSKNMTPKRATASGAESASLDKCLKADFVSLHLHVNDETRGILSRERIGQMKPGAYLINTSRAALVDQGALIDALREKRIAGAGIDVFEPDEPLPENSPFRSLGNVIITPHSAANTLDARAAQMRISTDNIETYLKESPKNLVREDA